MGAKHLSLKLVRPRKVTLQSVTVLGNGSVDRNVHPCIALCLSLAAVCLHYGPKPCEPTQGMPIQCIPIFDTNRERLGLV